MKKIIVFLMLILNLIGNDFQLSSLKVNQGDFFTIWSNQKNIEIIEIKGDFLRTTVVPYYKDGIAIAHIPVHYSNEIGTRDILIDYKIDGIKKRGIYSIYINHKEFENSKIYVDEKMEEKGTGENRATSINSSQNARANPIPDPLWQSNFVTPTKGRLTTGFGYSRYVNDKLTNRHSGLDIAAPIGTPIYASNKGVVVFSDYLNVTGHTIIIDHGGNIFTGYAHMEKRFVQNGQEIEKGEKIGNVGNSGFSTGPHLHFTLSVGTTFVDPALLMDLDLDKTRLQIEM